MKGESPAPPLICEQHNNQIEAFCADCEGKERFLCFRCINIHEEMYKDHKKSCAAFRQHADNLLIAPSRTLKDKLDRLQVQKKNAFSGLLELKNIAKEKELLENLKKSREFLRTSLLKCLGLTSTENSLEELYHAILEKEAEAKANATRYEELKKMFENKNMLAAAFVNYDEFVALKSELSSEENEERIRDQVQIALSRKDEMLEVRSDIVSKVAEANEEHREKLKAIFSEFDSSHPVTETPEFEPEEQKHAVASASPPEAPEKRSADVQQAEPADEEFQDVINDSPKIGEGFSVERPVSTGEPSSGTDNKNENQQPAIPSDPKIFEFPPPVDTRMKYDDLSKTGSYYYLNIKTGKLCSYNFVSNNIDMITVPDLPKLTKAEYIMVNGYLLICGGEKDGVCVNETYCVKVNSSTATVTPSCNMLKGRTDFALVELNGSVYAIGGESQKKPTDAVEMWNGSAWIKMKNLPVALTEPVACTIQNSIYVFGGKLMGGKSSFSVYMMTMKGDTSSWEEIDSTALKNLSGMSVAIPCGNTKVLLYGGGLTLNKKCYSFDLLTKNASPEPAWAFNGPETDFKRNTAKEVNGIWYILALKHFSIYILDNGKWITIPREASAEGATTVIMN